MKLLAGSLGFVLLCLGSIGQARSTSKLVGTIYDGAGAVIVKAKITAVNSKGESFEAISDKNGDYVLALPIGTDIRVEKYDLTAESLKVGGFKKTEIKQFIFIPGYSGKMRLDIGLETVRITPIFDP